MTVPRLLLREAIEFAQLEATDGYTLAIRDGESVHVGSTAIAASQSWPEIPPPPPYLTQPVAHHDVVLPAGRWESDEKVSIAAGEFQLTAMSGLLERFVGRDITRADLYLGGDGAFLVGTSAAGDPDDRLVLIIPAYVGP